MEYRIPKTLPLYVEVEPDCFRHHKKATGADWKKARQFARGRRVIHAMARLAEYLASPTMCRCCRVCRHLRMITLRRWRCTDTNPRRAAMLTSR